jgi:hypothetical protein
MTGAAAPPRDSPNAAEPAAPVAFATTERQDRERLASAPLRSAPRPSLLGAPVSTLRGAGPKLAAAAAELGIETLGELLLHVPHSYRDRSAPRPLSELRIGEQATVEVEVRSSRLRRTRRRGLVIVEATVADGSGPAKAVWFPAFGSRRTSSWWPGMGPRKWLRGPPPRASTPSASSPCIRPRSG